MITNTFKYIMAMMLESIGGNTASGKIKVKNTQGQDRYLGNRFSSFPNTVYTSVQRTVSSPGIYVGTGDTAPTANDYCLEQMITSGISASSSSITSGLDDSGNPFVQYLFTITNTTSSDITIKEVGYSQYLYVSNSLNGDAVNYNTLLLDRTVLTTPVTVPANDSAAIKYTLKTVIS